MPQGSQKMKKGRVGFGNLSEPVHVCAHTEQQANLKMGRCICKLRSTEDCQPTTRAGREACNTVSTSISNFQPPELCDDKFMLFKSPSLL